jgi:hypothetical protein
MLLANFTVKIRGFMPGQATKYKQYSIGMMYDAIVIDSELESTFRTLRRAYNVLFLLPFTITIAALFIFDTM